MSGSVNKAIVVGNLGNDPEIRTFQNGGRVANLSVATTEKWKDGQTGERREKTQWHRISVQSKGLVDICEKWLRKGAKVYIEGRMETRKYTDNSGAERYTTEVVLRPFNSTLQMLDGQGKAQDHNTPSGAGSEASQSGNPSFSDGPSGIDDEIPF